jgi:IgGFc binding protein
MRTNRRPHRLTTTVLLLGLPLVLAAAATCSATTPSRFTGAASSGAGAGSGAGGADAATASAAAGPLFDGAMGAGGNGTCSPCSADLKNVLDCNGNVIKTCAAGLACSAGTCVANPCDVASASKSTYGCEYWALNVDSIFPVSGSCFAAYVTNTWTVPITISVDYQGTQLPVAQFAKIPMGHGLSITYAPYDPATGLAPGNVAILFLSQTPRFLPPPYGGEPCPPGITTAVTVDPAAHGTAVGNAFHITTDGPVVAYQIFPYGGGNAAVTSASLLLPTSAWDVNYVAVNAYAASTLMGGGAGGGAGGAGLENPGGVPSLDILAAQDGTQVTISPVAAIAAGNAVPGTPTGTPITYALDEGQYIQFTQSAELTGSAILANKPVAVFGANACMNIPTDVSACDSGGQQIPPVRALGSEYATVRYRGRNGGTDEVVPWRLVGAVDGTQLTFTPPAPAGWPTSLSKGQLVEIDTPGPFVVASQDSTHPFYISAHMTGGSNFNGEGDPEFVNIIPTAQYLDSYTFFTDPTYPETNLVLVRAAGPTGFENVNLDCAGTVTGWTPLGAYEYTRVDLSTGNFQGVNGCNNGLHYISSKAPFAVTVWGWGSVATGLGLGGPGYTQYVSYAYPAGAGVKPVNMTVVMPMPIQ